MGFSHPTTESVYPIRFLKHGKSYVRRKQASEQGINCLGGRQHWHDGVLPLFLKPQLCKPPPHPIDGNHEAKMQPFLLRSDWESANFSAQEAYGKGAKLQKAGRALRQLLRVPVLAPALWREGREVKNTSAIKFTERFQHGVHDTRISSCCLSSKLSCLGFTKFNGNETCTEHGITGLYGGTAYSQALTYT